jgi:hypothetical protein
LGYDFRVERGAAFADPPDRGDEVVDVHDAILQ